MRILGWMAVFSVCVVSRGWAAMGIAEMKGTAENSPIQGTVQFTDTPKGVEVKAEFHHLPPGKHGFHIHEFGLCGDLGKAAGNHFNPLSAPHGHLVKSGLTQAHGGDLGNLEANAEGDAVYIAILPSPLAVAGATAIAGRAVIVHEKVDDFSQPLGNAGGRIACGPILIRGN